MIRLILIGLLALAIAPSGFAEVEAGESYGETEVSESENENEIPELSENVEVYEDETPESFDEGTAELIDEVEVAEKDQ